MNLSGNIITEVKKVISGKERVLWWILTAILARGHILIEDIPGVGKTTIALAFSKALGLDYGRVQFTPDVLPSDITGYTLYNKDTGAMTYQSGAILCNLFLADELNRATSRTQSALLEAMEEGQVTVDGTSHQIPKPFTVIATQNPTGASGTSLLPDSQLDRFSVRLSIGYPSPKSERAMVLNRQSGDPLKSVKQITSKSQLISMQSDCDSVFVKDEIVDYIVELIGKTRNNSMILRGASPRTTLSITALSKAMAYINGRDYVIPDDVGAVFCDAVEHRILLAPSAEAKGISGSSILEKILDSVKAPSIT
ncbi:MAG: MoxR family ATPase [Ruminococcaceae bacterium]|nr:MoxR family ATPase [Oscillospiraceae bacterium]